MAAVLVSVVALLAPPAALAIDNDHGWTHLANNDYPHGSPKPDCQFFNGGNGCIGWDDDSHIGRAGRTVLYHTDGVGWADPMYWQEYDASTARFVNTGAAIYAPHYRWDPSGRDLKVFFHNHGHRFRCATTSFELLNRPPTNHGCCQQFAIAKAYIWLNNHPEVTFSRTSPSGAGMLRTTCNLRTVYDHENGHTLGLGHTTLPSQTMHSSARNFGLQTYDRYGIQCIYDLWNCNTR